MTSVRFGDDLELDLKAYELRRSGQPVKLQRLPMEILLLLVENRGDLVTREQIIERIWGPGVFVDTDNSVNGAIRKLRLALGDDPENPRFISTVTGKGYRFIAPVFPLSGEQTAQAALEAPPETAGLPTAVVPAAPAARRWPIVLAAFVLVMVTAGAYLLWSRSSVAPSQSGGRVMLAVLPFENLTGDAGQDYFSDGLTEELISRLGNLAPGRLGVIARTSVMGFKQTHPMLDQVGRQLSVQYVLEGSVRRDADDLRITAQLIRLSDQTHVWAQQYDRKRSNILAVQAEIAAAIAGQIVRTFGDDRLPPARGNPALSAEEVEAYDDYLKGRFFWNKRTKEGFQQAIEAFQHSIARNPLDARAYAGLADTFALMATWGFAPRAEVVPKAREAAMKALQLDERLAAPYTTLALLDYYFDFDWQTAESRFRRAIELDSSYATAHQWYAEFLSYQGRFDEAIAEIDRARRLDPLSLIIATDRGVILTWARDYDRAIEQLRFVLSMDPNFARARIIVVAYAEEGRYDEALALIEEWHKTDDGPFPWAAMATVYARAGRRAEARQALEKMEEANRSGDVDPDFLCMTIRPALGDLDEAFACMQRACEEKPSLLIGTKGASIDAVRNDPRFKDILRCVHLQP